jgi:lysyl-tRNA synthetase class 2
MKPEKKVEILLSEEAKGIQQLIKAEGRADLNAIKQMAGLSNKKWDKAIKELTKNGLAKVEKTDEGLFVE